MIAVIFEVEPEEGRRDACLGLAAGLRPLLDGVDGFLSIERFQSLNDPDRILSLSFWRDEEAVSAWRNTGEHRQAQFAGRGGIFRGYRLRIAQVVRDYGMRERAQAPADSRAVHDFWKPPNSRERLEPPFRSNVGGKSRPEPARRGGARRRAT